MNRLLLDVSLWGTRQSSVRIQPTVAARWMANTPDFSLLGYWSSMTNHIALSCRTLTTVKKKEKPTVVSSSSSSSRQGRYKDNVEPSTYNKKKASSVSPPSRQGRYKEDVNPSIYKKKTTASSSSSSSSSRQGRYKYDAKPSTSFKTKASSSPTSRHNMYTEDVNPSIYKKKTTASSSSSRQGRYKDDAKPSTSFKTKASSSPTSRHNMYTEDVNPSIYKKKTKPWSNPLSPRNRYEDDAKPSTYNNSNNKKKVAPPVRGSAGRILTVQKQGVKASARHPKLCVGCGTEVVAAGGTVVDNKVQGMVAGQDAASGKRGRYVDAFSDPSLQFTTAGNVNGFLCERCKALKDNNIWKAYDSLRDVSPNVFADQLQHIVRRRSFSLCVMVVDATDAEHTTIKNLRRIIGSKPVILALNKIDLLPRFNKYDCRILTDKVQATSGLNIRKSSYGVSAVTDTGLVELAMDILRELGGKDVFVVGCANVGKSSLVKKLSALIASAVWYKDGSAKHREKRRLAAQNLNVTGSSLPGTTLQAVRVPCFSTTGNALWDTPGIINTRALQYHLFPSHLMEPMLHPGRIEVPTLQNGLACLIEAGYSILIEATWMDIDDVEADEDDNAEIERITSRDNEAYGVLGRIDIKEVMPRGDRILAEAYIHPALRIRIVPTELAPTSATVAPHHVETIKRKIRNATGQKETGLADAYSLPLSAYISPERPDGAFKADLTELGTDGWFRMDIVFASLGFVKFSHKTPYAVIPHCVEGSVISKCSPGLYPSRLYKFLEDEGTPPESEPREITEEVLNELRDAAKEGRHHSNREL